MRPVSTRLTVATYNIHHGKDVALDWMRLAAPITACRADIVGLQEVDMGTSRVNGQNTVLALKEATGLPFAVFAPAMDYKGGQYGLALLTRYPVTEHRHIPLPTAVGVEPRVCLYAVLDVHGEKVHILVTHLTYNHRLVRVRQLGVLQTILPTEAPFVLLGDLNTSEAEELAQLIADPLATVNSPAHLFMTIRQPPNAIDHIVYDTRRWIVTDQGMIDVDASDHNLLYATLERQK